MNLKNKVALITGAGSGIGAATAQRMADAGACIAATGIPADGVQVVATTLNDSGHAAIGISLDVTDEGQIEAAVAQTVDEFGRLDIIVANAAVQLHDRDINLHQLPQDVWDATHDVNYKGVYLTCKHALAQFLRQGDGGVIIITASVAGLGGAGANPAYIAGKHGLLGLNRHIAIHYAKHGIRCNAVCPGALERTPNHDIHLDPVGREERFKSRIPLGRLGRPDDIAPFITFLATEDASYATGAYFVIDGGLTAG